MSHTICSLKGINNFLKALLGHRKYFVSISLTASIHSQ